MGKEFKKTHSPVFLCYLIFEVTYGIVVDYMKLVKIKRRSRKDSIILDWKLKKNAEVVER